MFSYLRHGFAREGNSSSNPYYGDAKWKRSRLKSQASRLLVRVIQLITKKSINLPITNSFVTGIHRWVVDSHHNHQSWQWRHNDHDGDSNHQPHGCLLNRLFRRRSKITSNSALLAFVWGNHRDRWIPRTNGQLRGKCFHLMTSSWIRKFSLPCWLASSCIPEKRSALPHLKPAIFWITIA